MGRIDLPNLNSEKSLPTPSSRVIGGSGLLDSYGKPLEDCDAGIIVPKREIVIPKEVRQVSEDRERLASEIEKGKVDIRSNPNGKDKIDLEKIFDSTAAGFRYSFNRNPIAIYRKLFAYVGFGDANESIQENIRTGTKRTSDDGVMESIAIESIDQSFITIYYHRKIL